MGFQKSISYKNPRHGAPGPIGTSKSRSGGSIGTAVGLQVSLNSFNWISAGTIYGGGSIGIAEGLQVSLSLIYSTGYW